ncbi:MULTISPECIES: DUF3099 domain-containing protein [unclassified Streptomyces]|uniref:DUF3099 domain-containing protein n=1 Tax=unclassified Streptomyces TaxID=2593676 RepID=UPI0033D9B30A
MRKHKETEVFRITGARQGLADDVRGRQRRYVISMSIRTLAVVLAAVLWNVERHVAIVALVLGAALPYIAVVIANAGRESAPKPLATFVPAPTRPALESGTPAPRPAPEDTAHTGRAVWSEHAGDDAESRAEDASEREFRRG